MAAAELKNQESSPASSAELSESDATTGASTNKWEELLRKMLPAGAPVPDEDHLDYSITVEYQGPPPCLPSSTCISIPKPLKFSSSFKTHNSLLISRKNSNLVSSIARNRDSSDEKSRSSFSSCSVPGNFLFSSCDTKVDDGKSVDFSANFDTNDRIDKGKIGAKVKRCSRCGEGGWLVLIREKREVCMVCGAEYCRHCVLKAMGSMPEGRKCVGCIGKPIDEANREKLGRCSRLLASICSPLEISHIMKAEKECSANQIRSEQVVVNGRPLKEEELVEVMGCAHPPCDLRPGRYWYDNDSGLWGKDGEKPVSFISANLKVGGKLLNNASNGNTKVYINGREITKPELRILKLANVQCPRGTHFWLYEDGSYEEEGQKNIRGNIWEKATTRLICSLLSLPVPFGNARWAKEDQTTFSGRPVGKYLEPGKVHKLLLLGLEGSGTSTIFKQMKFIYGNQFSAQELQDIKLLIQSNVYRYLSVLLEGREHFEDEALLAEKAQGLTAEESLHSSAGGISPDRQRKSVYSIEKRLRNFSDWLLDTVARGDLDTFFPAAAREYAPIADEVWKDPAIQETYKRREELHCLPDVAKYFLDRAIEISSNEYEPSEEDILNAEGVIPNNGLALFEFSSDDHSTMSETGNDNSEVHPPSSKYQLIRISSKGLLDSSKWLEMFEGFRALVYCVSLSDYDQMVAHDTCPFSNKLLASRYLFESLARHPSFEDIPFVLLLNKYDAFEEKINLVPLSVCEWFSDFSPSKPHHNSQSLAHQAYYYIAVKFKLLYTSITRKKLFVRQTNGRDSESVHDAFKYIREIIKWDEEARNVYGIYENDSFYSPERSSSPNIRGG
ncbi:extra-large guanine nucleotide-binding protein 3-like [Coffea eugenioides]|uniref:extra-large guanine nucleotide-binding protein 3-like n=1 Tax=Coffea eugenioides TaxID=49369 RepID=UPI000F60F342|nr:extra-large guanine nucleotide-binding protein 3-like [Coffea eugenioides]